MQLDAAKRLVELAERYADGEASEAEFRAANALGNFPGLDLQYSGQAPPGTQLSACALSAIGGARWLAAENFRKSHGAYGVAQETCQDRTKDYIPTLDRPCGGKCGVPPDNGQLAERITILRDIFGNPFRPVATNAAWLTPTAFAIAQTIYTDRAFDRLPILADALEDACCTDAAILDHLRGPGPHVRGCFALDLVLGKS